MTGAIPASHFKTADSSPPPLCAFVPLCEAFALLQVEKLRIVHRNVFSHKGHKGFVFFVAKKIRPCVRLSPFGKVRAARRAATTGGMEPCAATGKG